MGETKVQDKCVRGSNKGITEITAFPGSSKIEQMFMSHNEISSLEGIQKFPNLRVLSIGFNNVSKISDLRFLEGLNLETINMEANPISKLPYYQHHVVSLLPSLGLFDGKTVTDALREKAQSTVDFDTERLTNLCINEARLCEMDALLKNRTDMSEIEWLRSVQKMLGPLTLDSFNMSEEEIRDAFDKMREVALDLRKKQQNNKMKWSDIYNMIEDVQRKATEELSAKIQVYVRDIKATASSSSSSSIRIAKKKQSTPASGKKKQMSPTNALSNLERMLSDIPSPQHSKCLDSDATLPNDTVSPMPQRIVPIKIGPMSPISQMKREDPIVEHLGRVFERMQRKQKLCRFFYNWKCRFSAASRVPVLALGSGSAALLEQAQEYISRISDLEAALDAQRKDNAEIQAALEESVKNEGKMKKIVKRVTQEKKALEVGLKDSERRYEEDVLQFILESKFKNETSDFRISELEAEIARLKNENASLNQFIQETQETHKKDVDDLQDKLSNAFDVTSEFRKEISKLKGQLADSANNSPTGSWRSTRSESPESPPMSAGSTFRRRRNSDLEVCNIGIM